MEKICYPVDRITENGKAVAHIVIGAEAPEVIRCAAEELSAHVKKVSGAEMTVVSEGREGSLPIIIATPDTHPELEAFFPEDLTWLRTLSEGRKHWGSDGFSVRVFEEKLYIFGATARGALNGTYDFMEKNMGILWGRGNEDYGTIYTEMPTIMLEKINYREKSPFEVRGWHFCANSKPESDVSPFLISRNKVNTWSTRTIERMGIAHLGVSHNVKRLVKDSPVYDPTVQEYWNTLEDGSYGTYETSVQINFFSDKTAEAVAASVVQLVKEGRQYPFVGIEDVNNFGSNANDDGVPFEYAPAGLLILPHPSITLLCFSPLSIKWQDW